MTSIEWVDEWIRTENGNLRKSSFPENSNWVLWRQAGVVEVDPLPENANLQSPTIEDVPRREKKQILGDFLPVNSTDQVEKNILGILGFSGACPIWPPSLEIHHHKNLSRRGKKQHTKNLKHLCCAGQSQAINIRGPIPTGRLENWVLEVPF